MTPKPIAALMLALCLGVLPACAEQEPESTPGSAAGADATQPDTARADPAQLPIRVAAFQEAFNRSDFDAVIDFMPPGIKATLMRQHSVTEAQLRAATTEAMAQLLTQVSLDSFDMDVAASRIETTTDGRRSYALIPTETVMRAPDGSQIRAATQTLAIEEDGEWYLYRIEEQQQIDMLVATYPEFAGIQLPLGSVTPIQ